MGLRWLDALAQPKLEMVRGQCHTLEMALEELAIFVGQLLPGVASRPSARLSRVLVASVQSGRQSRSLPCLDSSRSERSLPNTTDGTQLPSGCPRNTILLSKGLNLLLPTTKWGVAH